LLCNDVFQTVVFNRFAKSWFYLRAFGIRLTKQRRQAALYPTKREKRGSRSVIWRYFQLTPGSVQFLTILKKRAILIYTSKEGLFGTEMAISAFSSKASLLCFK
jgi:hypothetical protein